MFAPVKYCRCSNFYEYIITRNRTRGRGCCRLHRHGGLRQHRPVQLTATSVGAGVFCIYRGSRNNLLLKMKEFFLAV
ncbi:hypothetical protein PATSB16_06420 [Pandoraea thiooxydans]|nr:hypothetical protein PATSB16_06420 [Pandoraea thiooxydans]